jgi:hypothetical protein
MTAYATVAQLRARINKSSSADDAVLTQLLQAATNAIDRLTNRDIAGVDVFYPTATVARTYAGSGKPFQWIDECISIASVAVKDSISATAYTAWTAADWLPFSGSVFYPDFSDTPYSGLLCAPNGDYSIFTGGGYGGADEFFGLSRPYYNDTQRSVNYPTVQVTARWGVTTTPPDEIREACAALAARWWKRFESAMSDALASAELGKLDYTQAVDPDIKMMLQNSRWYKPQIARRY